MRSIGLLDCNNFFVSCERVFRPDLEKVPVVVLSSNDGCVVARSQEIKDMGISMGVPYFLIKDKLEEVKAAVFSSNFNLYKDISKRVFETVKTELKEVERYSIDECFFTIDSLDVKTLEILKERVRREVGIPVSIGVSSSRTLAKYANQLAKKTKQVVVLEREEWDSLSDKVRLSELWGVGVGRAREFSKHKIIYARDLINTPDFIVDRLYGINGLRLKNELSGQFTDYKHKEPGSVQNSIISSRSFAKTTTKESDLRRALSSHVASVVRELHQSGWLAKGLRIYIYPSFHGDFSLAGGGANSVFLAPTNDIFVIEKEVSRLLGLIYKEGVPYKKAGVVLTDLVPDTTLSLSLFSGSDKTQEVTETLVKINKKFGLEALRVGTVSQKNAVWQSRKDLLSPEYTTDWKGLRTVVAN